jgi:hypothetical protein
VQEQRRNISEQLFKLYKDLRKNSSCGKAEGNVKQKWQDIEHDNTLTRIQKQTVYFMGRALLLEKKGN